MRLNLYRCAGIALFALTSAAHATTFTFNTDPFAGTTALATPGRQIVANEDFIDFDPSKDVFSLESTIFHVGPAVSFANTTAPNIPNGVNIIVLETFDDDNNLGTAFAAGNAANLIANKITTPGAGFFIYFNQTLNVPRLVFSTDLNDNTADLKILARLTNLSGATGRDTLAYFTAGNFEITTAPEPSSIAMFSVAGLLGLLGAGRRLRKQKA